MAQQRCSRKQLHNDVKFYSGSEFDDPLRRISQELHLSSPANQEYRQIIDEILTQAQREDISRDEIISRISTALPVDLRHNFNVIVNQSWWSDWPWIECTAFDEESMLRCPCDSCVAIKIDRSHKQRQAEEFERMLEDMRERARKPWYRGWSANDPRPNPGSGRPRNIRRHFTFKRLNKDNYECEDCGKIGGAWDMDYTPCPNSSPPHEQKKLRSPTWGECTLCNNRWEYGEGPTAYGDCPVKGQNHGWMDPRPLIDDSLYMCGNCNQTGPFHELAYSICPDPDLTPCDYCNIAGMCAADCPGIGEALGKLIEGVVDENEEDDQEAWSKPWTPDY